MVSDLCWLNINFIVKIVYIFFPLIFFKEHNFELQQTQTTPKWYKQKTLPKTEIYMKVVKYENLRKAYKKEDR